MSRADEQVKTIQELYDRFMDLDWHMITELETDASSKDIGDMVREATDVQRESIATQLLLAITYGEKALEAFEAIYSPWADGVFEDEDPSADLGSEEEEAEED